MPAFVPNPRHALFAAIGCACIALSSVACKRTTVQDPPGAGPIAWGDIPTTPAQGGKPDRFLVPGADADHDGVTDDRERALRSNPDAADSDRDGFADGFEDRHADYGFRIVAADADRDRDGLTDAREKELGSDPARTDSDGDGWGDFDEEFNRYFGFDPRTTTQDADFDGLSDALEMRLKSAPDAIDSNGDGISDFQAYAADLPPAGAKLPGPPAEIVGITYSEAMARALEAVRKGAGFPPELARQLPYPDATAPVLGDAVRPSAALMQRSLYNPHNSPGLYPTYAEVEQLLFKIADTYDGNPGPKLVRLFYWTGQTQDTCDRREGKGGRRIYALKVSRDPDQNDPGKPEVAFIGVHHARELITAMHTLGLLQRLTDGYATDPDVQSVVDKRETWVIPVVNPNGYDRAVSNLVDWRKNARLEDGQDPKRCGIDINRNYGFEHVASFPPAQRATLPDVQFTGVDTATGNLLPDMDTYPGAAAFSEVETQAVRGLAHSQFVGRKREIDGLVCALSWHSYGGVVGHPMGHVAIAGGNVDPPDVAPFGLLTNAMANAAAYTDVKDGFPALTTVDGCSYTGYAVYGDSNDWMYKDGDTFATLIESYSVAERGGCPVGSIPVIFYPQTAAGRDAVAKANVEAALAMLKNCPP